MSSGLAVDKTVLMVFNISFIVTVPFSPQSKIFFWATHKPDCRASFVAYKSFLQKGSEGAFNAGYSHTPTNTAFIVPILLNPFEVVVYILYHNSANISTRI